MRNTFDKLVGLFCIIVFMTLMINHGHIDFSGVDWVRDRTIEAIQSEEGQQYINETKDIAKDVFHDIFWYVADLFKDE